MAALRSLPYPLPFFSHSLQASTSDTDQIFRDIFLGITTAHTGSGERCGARQVPGAEGQRAAAHGPQGKARARTREGLGLYKVAGRAEDSPEPAIGEAHLGLHAGGGEEKAQSSWSLEEKAGGSEEAEQAYGKPLPAGSQGLPSGKGRASSENGVKRRKGRVRRGAGAEPRLRGVGAAAGGDPASWGHRPPPWLWWWLGEDGASVSAPSPSAWGQVSPSPHCSETPRALPLPERPAALPSQLSSGPSSAALVRASVQQGLPARQQGGRMDGRPRVGSLGRVGFPQAFPSSRTHQCPWPG